MADGSYRFHQTGAGPFYYQHNQQVHHQQRNLARNGSPVNNGRIGFNNDTPSPSRSPVSQAATHNPYSIFNPGHQQGQHGLMNGSNSAHQRYMQMNMPHKYQHQSHQHHNQPNHHQHNHGGHPPQGALGHQHNFSSGLMSNSTPSFTPGGLQSGTPNELHEDSGEQVNEHWQYQIQQKAELRQSGSTPHHHSKKEGASKVNRTDIIVSSEVSQKAGDAIERRATIQDNPRQDWAGLDLSGQGIRNLSPTLFIHYEFLDRLYLDHNKLKSLPPCISRLRSLSILDVTKNELNELPQEIGMLVNLKELRAYDNNITALPSEVGYLCKLEVLGLEGNPLDEDLKELIMDNGTRALVMHLRDQKQGAGPPPTEREMVIFDEYEADEGFSVLNYNILCDRYATVAMYGYTPTRALSWDYRRDLILEEFKKRDADVICLQEINTETNEFFKRELAFQGYRGVFWPKPRARTMPEKEARLVDGCATFYKAQKFIMLDKQLVDFANLAINRPDMKGEHDIFNRVMPRDYIAVLTFFENRMTGSRFIVGNAHIFWDPEFTDVKLVQVAILMEQITKFADQWAASPPSTDKKAFQYTEQDSETDPEVPEEQLVEPSPSLEYANGSQIPLVMCGDFNAVKDTGIYDLIEKGALPGDHPDLGNYHYGNFTRDGISHPFKLKSAYGDSLRFTNYTPGYTEVIDYIWHSHNSLKVRKLLGDVDHWYLQKVPGFPHFHFPSDHLALFAEFSVEPRKERPKPVEADFGPQRALRAFS